MKRDTALQLSMFEPEGSEVLALLSAKLSETEKSMALADRFELLGMRGAVAAAERAAEAAMADALVFAILLDIEREAGL